MWSVGPQLLPKLPISQVPKPPRIHTIAVAQTNRDNPGQRHQKAQHQQRDRIGHQVLPVGVQQRREDDPPQAVGFQRPDAVASSVPRQLVDQLDEVQQRDEGEDRGPADHPPAAVSSAGSRGAWRPRHGPGSCP